MYDHRLHRRSASSRLTWGIILLAVGGCLLAVNLGMDIPYRVWNYWPFLLIGLGVAQLILPGRPRDRLGGYWLTVVGLWGTVNMFGFLGLHWGNSWPIFVIAAGLRVLIGSLFTSRTDAPDQNGQSPSDKQSANQSDRWSRNN
jgi:hypothetical protein